MSAKIIIVGVDHSDQCGVGAHSEELKNFIASICEKYSIKFIAEEMTLQGIKDRGAKTTVALKLSQNIPGVIHKFIDIDDETRSKLNIDRKSLAKIAPIFNENPHRKTEINDKLEKLIFFPVRECCWLSAILYEKKWPALLICGESHVTGMQHLIRKVNKRTLVGAFYASECMTSL